jgi:hypothetical protein
MAPEPPAHDDRVKVDLIATKRPLQVGQVVLDVFGRRENRGAGFRHGRVQSGQY